MTRKLSSDINYVSINENFPVAGQDNDTQVFRDNFDTIKNSLRYAKEEITDILDKSAFLDESNDFENNVIERAIFQNCTDRRSDRGTIDPATSQLEIDYTQGNYQVCRFQRDCDIVFSNFPESGATTGQIGKVTMEFYGDGSNRTLSFIASGGVLFRKNPTFPASVIVSSTTAPVIIEAWRHNGTYIFLNYLGQFS